MELKGYQSDALDAFAEWLDLLEKARHEAAEDAEYYAARGREIPGDALNYPRNAWQWWAQSGKLAADAGEYISRTDEAGRPVPHICFKVPTGGGKTLLAAAALERLNRKTGLTLWLTPTNAIYEQTKAALKNREHPYRQILELASDGRVKFMEKSDQFNRADCENYLCVMLLSLPAANRHRNREFLKMFRDSGQYASFFPDDGDAALGDGQLLERFPDLERNSDDGPVLHSLFNVIKMQRPVVILDEAHKAYGAAKREANVEFARAVSRLDPSLVIELSATPNRGISNLLVNISGPQLKQEQMIKSPVKVTAYDTPSAPDWRNTLSDARDLLDKLEAEARALEMGESRYIRPIAVVRVERTGNDQRDGIRVHAEDVREYLLGLLNQPEESVKVKSSVNDELGRENLLSESSQVRWIITKNALMEGWDCPFAYVLVMLDNTSAQRAITQLVGRVLRQPGASYTGRPALDQCYVYCNNTNVNVAVNQVKNGLEQEGLSGLADEVMAASGQARQITVQRQERFRGQNIFLPKVSHQEGDGWVELDYQSHILPGIDWENIPEPDPQGAFKNPARRLTAAVDVDDIANNVAPEVESQELEIDKTIDISWFARRLSDLMPSAWQSGRIAKQLVERLRAAGETDDQIYDQRSIQASYLREYIKDEVEQRAEKIFRAKLKRGEIRFDLETGQPSFQMQQEYEITMPEKDGLMAGNDGRQLQLSLFAPVYTRQFDSDLERNFARYLDEQKALQWWHRVAVRQRGDYYIQGWRRNRVWPDFVAMAGAVGGKPSVLVFETKGEHLQGNDDTVYKERLYAALEKTFNNNVCGAGKMTINDGPAKGVFRLVFDQEGFPDAAGALSGLQGGYAA